MGEVPHGSATTTQAARAATRRAHASGAEMAERYSLTEETVRTRRERSIVEDARMGPEVVRSPVLGPAEVAMCVALRRRTTPPLGDCLRAFGASIPYPGRTAPRRLFPRRDISGRPDMEGDKPERSKFKRRPIVRLRIDLGEGRTEEGRVKAAGLPRARPSTRPRSASTRSPPTTARKQDVRNTRHIFGDGSTDDPDRSKRDPPRHTTGPKSRAERPRRSPRPCGGP